MRTTTELYKDARKHLDNTPSMEGKIAQLTIIQIELLSDIRDLLIEQRSHPEAKEISGNPNLVDNIILKNGTATL